VNGREANLLCRPGTFVRVERQWRKGDALELELPMPVRTVKGRQRQAGRFAVLRGPVVYSLDVASVPSLKGKTPHEAQALFALDPESARWQDGKMTAKLCASHDWKRGSSEVALTPFAAENANLTYFRPRDPKSPKLVCDELFAK